MHQCTDSFCSLSHSHSHSHTHCTHQSFVHSSNYSTNRRAHCSLLGWPSVIIMTSCRSMNYIESTPSDTSNKIMDGILIFTVHSVPQPRMRPKLLRAERVIMKSNDNMKWEQNKIYDFECMEIGDGWEWMAGDKIDVRVTDIFETFDGRLLSHFAHAIELYDKTTTFCSFDGRFVKW